MDKLIFFVINEFLVPITIVIFLWLIALSVVFYFIYSHYSRLIKIDGVGDLRKILDTVLSAEKENAVSIKEIRNAIERIDEELSHKIRKVGLVKYNPFNDIGGNQSFTVAILDSHGDGVLITGLHARGATRVYVKDVVRGKSKYELSREETRAIQSVMVN